MKLSEVTWYNGNIAFLYGSGRKVQFTVHRGTLRSGQGLYQINETDAHQRYEDIQRSDTYYKRDDLEFACWLADKEQDNGPHCTAQQNPPALPAGAGSSAGAGQA